MEQRPLRLGDIVDDYCPRERRITNHAVVALVGDAIKQTRCTTCDAEHVYKDAKVPRRISLRKKDDAPGQLVAVAHDARNRRAHREFRYRRDHDRRGTARRDRAVRATRDTERPDEGGTTAWIGHRPLIRATLAPH